MVNRGKKGDIDEPPTILGGFSEVLLIVAKELKDVQRIIIWSYRNDRIGQDVIFMTLLQVDNGADHSRSVETEEYTVTKARFERMPCTFTSWISDERCGQTPEDWILINILLATGSVWEPQPQSQHVSVVKLPIRSGLCAFIDMGSSLVDLLMS